MYESLLNYQEFFGDNVKKKNIIFVAHGLFGSKRNWVNTAKLLSEELEQNIVALDLRNHGYSFWSDSHDYESLAEDLIRLADHYGNKVDLVGHSMGGKAAMSACLSNSEKFDKLVVVDIAPVTYSHIEFELYIGAMKSIDLCKMKSRSQVDQQLEFSVPNKQIRNLLLQNIFRKKEGNYNWKINLNSLKKNVGEILSFPKYQSKFLGQTLFFKGQQSSYISKDAIIEINKYFPQNKIKEIKQAGHWLHIDQPNIFRKELIEFLR